jgi:hypothetical protein
MWRKERQSGAGTDCGWAQRGAGRVAVDRKYMTLILFGEPQSKARSPLTSGYDSLLCTKRGEKTHFSEKSPRVPKQRCLKHCLNVFQCLHPHIKDKTSKQVCTGGYNAKITFPIILLKGKLPPTLFNSIVVQKYL